MTYGPGGPIGSYLWRATTCGRSRVKAQIRHNEVVDVAGMKAILAKLGYRQILRKLGCSKMIEYRHDKKISDTQLRSRSIRQSVGLLPRL